jgi:phage tail-like protein
MAYSGASYFATDVSWEVQRTNHFEVLITELTTASEKIRLAVESVRIPSISLQTTELRHGNETVKVATSPSFDGGDVVMKDAVGEDLELAFYNWFTQVYDPETGLMGNASDYKKVMRLVQYSPNGQTSRTWKCVGCFPTSFVPGDLSYANPDKKLISSTISVDRCFPER